MKSICRGSLLLIKNDIAFKRETQVEFGMSLMVTASMIIQLFAAAKLTDVDQNRRRISNFLRSIDVIENIITLGEAFVYVPSRDVWRFGQIGNIQCYLDNNLSSGDHYCQVAIQGLWNIYFWNFPRHNNQYLRKHHVEGILTILLTELELEYEQAILGQYHCLSIKPYQRLFMKPYQFAVLRFGVHDCKLFPRRPNFLSCQSVLHFQDTNNSLNSISFKSLLPFTNSLQKFYWQFHHQITGSLVIIGKWIYCSHRVISLLSILDPINKVLYTAFIHGICAVLSKTWIDVSGSSPNEVAKQLKEQDMKIVGYRDSSMKDVLYDIFQSLLPSVECALEAIGSGTNILLQVTIIYGYIETLKKRKGTRYT
ncbi:unnamed protein product (macronuclear) [Paramecium tetraurelia]|uniref:Uncharacterized protein n=1 Tax=Paramecium tetraurelia TaxID=5888 RepID=A0BY98_PARTE|nr:uncharacterized protein GSPATT00033368001 [Paramecium tetraurelia]CAK63515.1 unnamed protein product [Paramecium tetraurelia]|eukprot:XP_001430913.1 hypothetical protein (macronuclear) [Paramecium tetraurelia strain d4-2]